MKLWRSFAWWIIAGVFSVMTLGCQHMVTNSNGEQLPKLYIYAADADTLYVKCRQKIDADAILIDEKGDTVIDESLEYIKSRGNSTFRDKAKKPFAIKFNRRKDILGLYKSKKFVLLANAFDESHIRTAIAFDLAERIGVAAPRYAYVVLYINDEYKGLYQMVNAREISRCALNIADLQNENKKLNALSLADYPQVIDTVEGKIKGYMFDNIPEDITGGYMFGYTHWHSVFDRERCGFYANTGDILTLEEPKYASVEEVKYIQSYYNQMEDALADTTTERYMDYIDVASFARYYLLQEFLLNQDAGWISTYLYKDSGDSSKLCAGPLWDTDISLMTSYWAGRVLSPNMFWINRALGEQYHACSEGVFFRLWQHESFRDSVKYIYTKEMSPIIHQYLESGMVETLQTRLCDEVQRDYKKNGNRLSASYKEAVAIPKNFLHERLAFMDWYFSTSRDEMICITDKSTTKVFYHDRQITLFFPKNTLVVIPQPRSSMNSHALIPEWYICGTDSLLAGQVIFSHDCDIEIRERAPKWYEIRRKQLKNVSRMIFEAARKIYYCQ